LPSEASRLARRVGPRDRRFLAGLAALAVIGAAAGAVSLGGGPAPVASCVSFDAPGVMGGGTWHLCGGAARSFCTAHAGESRTLAVGCAVLGAPPSPEPAGRERTETTVATRG
jgi:hypothetical protein